MKISKKGSWNI